MPTGGPIVVTGAAGLVGRAIVAELARRGRPVRALVHEVDGKYDLAEDVMTVDLTNPDALDEAFHDAEGVVHLAARSGGIGFQSSTHDDVLRMNHRLTSNVLAAARAAGASQIFLASSAVVYRDRHRPLVEGDELVSPGAGPVSGYAWSKITDEVLADWYAGEDLRIVVGRFTNIYGPGGSFDPARSTVVHALVRRAVETPAGHDLVVWGSGRATRSFLFVDDCARAVLTILEHGTGGHAYNVDSGDPVTIRQLAETVRDAVDPALRLDFDTSKPEGTPFRVLDPSALRGLGFAPEVSLADGIAATVSALHAES